MEALLELNKVQRVLSLMSSRGFCDTGSSGGGGAADRFLAQFLRFMEQPSDSLSMEKKFLLVSELLGKATPDTLEEVQHLTCLEADHDISCGALLQPNKKFKMHAEKSTIQAAPMVGFDAMTRAKSTLEDFLDASNEDSLDLVPDNSSSSKELERKKKAFDETSLSQMIEPLDSLLQRQGLMIDRLQTELKSGIQYWSLERKLCQALMRNEKISIEDVMKAIHLKSFDYRVLNLLMYQLTGQKVNELHMDFLSISEFLVEISDDLFDYEDDVMNNTFNILCMFAVIYGPSEAPNMLVKCIGEAEEKYESFSKKLDPSLSGSYWRRCEEATKEGGKNIRSCIWNMEYPSCDKRLRIVPSSCSQHLQTEALPDRCGLLHLVRNCMGAYYKNKKPCQPWLDSWCKDKHKHQLVGAPIATSILRFLWVAVLRPSWLI